MSDDLVNKLYDRRVCSPAQNSCRNDLILNRATNRIEELEAKLATCEKYRDAYAECDRIGAQAVRQLEARVKALESALRDVIDEYDRFRRDEYERGLSPLDDEIDDARATLAELKGQNT